MKKIIFGFSKPKIFKIGAEAIKLWLDSEYSHVFIMYIDDQDREVVFQAAHGTIHPILYSNFLKENIVVDVFPWYFIEEDYNHLRDFYYEKMGEKYAYKDLAIIVIHDILNRIGIHFNSNNFTGYVCSSLAAQMLVEVRGVKFDKPVNLIRPNDLYNFLKEIDQW